MPAFSQQSRRRRLRITKQSTSKELRARRALNKALRKMEPRLAIAFGKAVQVIIGQPGLLRKLTQAIQDGDLTGAQDVLGMENLTGALAGEGLDPDIRTFQAEVMEAMREGGKAGQLQMGPKLASTMGSLDLTNPAALTYLRETLPTQIREITQESVEAVQAALLRGFEEGRPAVQIAREVRDSIGLTRSQSQAVANFRRELETGQLIGKTPSKRRLSATEQAQAGRFFREAQAGRPVSRKQIDTITSRYHDSLLNRRAKNIARTETTRAFGEGQTALWDQAVERGLLDPSKTRRKWLVTRDERLREQHAAVPPLNPDGVRLDEPFNTPIGPVMAPRTSGVASFDVNCLLPGNKVSGEFVSGLKSWYSGEAIEIITDAGERLSVTPNHPVLTTTGIKPVHSICEGDYLVSDGSQITNSSPGTEEKQNEPALIEEVFQSLSEFGSTLLPVTLFDLHGDASFIDGDVRQVGADLLLKDRWFTGFYEQLRQLFLIFSNISTASGCMKSSLQQDMFSLWFTPDSIMSSLDLLLPFILAHLRPLNPLGIGLRSESDSLLSQYSRDSMSGDPKLIAELINRGSGHITTTKVIGIRRYPFSGHVYDLQSTNGWIVSDGIVVGNCRCTLVLEIDE